MKRWTFPASVISGCIAASDVAKSALKCLTRFTTTLSETIMFLFTRKPSLTERHLQSEVERLQKQNDRLLEILLSLRVTGSSLPPAMPQGITLKAAGTESPIDKAIRLKANGNIRLSRHLRSEADKMLADEVDEEDIILRLTDWGRHSVSDDDIDVDAELEKLAEDEG